MNCYEVKIARTGGELVRTFVAELRREGWRTAWTLRPGTLEACGFAVLASGVEDSEKEARHQVSAAALGLHLAKSMEGFAGVSIPDEVRRVLRWM